MKKKILSGLAIGIFGLCIAGVASASTFTVSASDRGHFQNSGIHYRWISNYAVGNDLTNREFRGFYVFDMSSLIDHTITGATLSLFLPSDGYSSPDPSETVTLYDVLSTNIPDLLGDSGTITDTSIFDDLGTGESYGMADIFSSSAGSYIDIVLGSESLIDLNSAVGSNLAIGAAATSLNYGDGTQEVVFVNTQSVPLDHTFLTLEATPIPIPASIFLFGTGLAGLIGTRLKRKKK